MTRPCRVLLAGIALTLVTALGLMIGGCDREEPAAPLPSAHVLGLNSVDETVSIDGQQYRLTAGFEPTGVKAVEHMTVTLKYVSFSSATPRDTALELFAYGPNGAPRVEPASWNGLGSNTSGSRTPSEGESFPPGTPRAWADVTQVFSVKSGETGIVVVARGGRGPEVRWLVR